MAQIARELIRYGTHPEQFGELCRGDKGVARPLVILIHGGFWRDQYKLELMHPLADALCARGYASWNIEYRRVGHTGGGFPTTLDDVSAAIDWVETSEWNRIVVIGHSAGGHLALWNASRTDAAVTPELTVGLAPVADVIAANKNGVGVDATTNFFGADYDAARGSYHTGQPRPEDFAGRVVLIHGTLDESVPLEQSTALTDQVARVEVLDGVDHFDVIDPNHASWRIVFDELDALADRT